MKSHNLLLLIILTIFVTGVVSAQNASLEIPAALEENIVEPSRKEKHINFFIVSKRKKGAVDLASRFNVLRTKMKSFFRKKKFVAIVARDGKQMSAKVRYRLAKYGGRIGTIWFDSHGMYKKGYSLFTIGKDEYSFKTLRDSAVAAPLKELSPYSDEQTKVIIGSCYGGATYHRASIDYRDTTRMNGDSLMMEMGSIFRDGSVYASESWVMTKPGLFLKREAVAGFPGRKLFRDVCYQPAWENAGKWNVYQAKENNIKSVNPITLDQYGNLLVRSAAYMERVEVKKEIQKNLARLEKGLYK
jgi:hypothetical protein